MPQWRGTIAPRQWKKRGGGERGYLDNRAGDRSTMAAVFSIRHYLIDRVAGLIVQGDYFRAAFVWGSAISPPPQHPRPRRGPVILCATVRICACMCVSVDRKRAFYVACYLLSISGGQSVACYMGQSCRQMEEEGEKTGGGR